MLLISTTSNTCVVDISLYLVGNTSLLKDGILIQIVVIPRHISHIQAVNPRYIGIEKMTTIAYMAIQSTIINKIA